ncbi:MAG TPA: hypothetical protein VII68_15730 [Casimicrobiaceae bacterium]|jgi:hypothetical protein
MPHVDELLGPATLAAAGLFAAIALHPAAPAVSAAKAPTAVVAEDRTSEATVLLPAVEVVGRRGPQIAAHAAAKRKASG